MPEAEEPAEECRVVDVDGTPVVVRGSAAMDAEESNLFLDLIRAVKAAYTEDLSEDQRRRYAERAQRGRERIRALRQRHQEED